jgi:hypothetical protein
MVDQDKGDGRPEWSTALFKACLNLLWYRMTARKNSDDDNKKKLTRVISTKLSIEDYNHFEIYTKAAHAAGMIDEPKPSKFLRYIATVLFEGLLDKVGSSPSRPIVNDKS